MKGFAALLLAIHAASAVAASPAEKFGARHWTTGPTLSVDRQADICQQILADADQLFASTAPDFDLASALSTDFKTLEQQALPGRPAEDRSLTRVDIDLEGDGRLQTIVFRSNEMSWRGDWHYAYVFPSVAAFEAASEEIAKRWGSTPEQQYPDPETLELDSQQFYPIALTAGRQHIDTGDVWAEPSLFVFEERVFLVQGSSIFDRYTPAPISVFRLRASGRVELTCQIDQRRTEEAHKAFEHLPAVQSFLAAIRDIGAGGDDGGTLHSGLRHDAQAHASEMRAAARPWAAPFIQQSDQEDHPYYRYDERTQAFLEEWSLQELWNRREYQTLLELIPAAEASYASYLQRAFGMSAALARSRSTEVIRTLIGIRLLIPNRYEAGEGEGEEALPLAALRRALIRRDRQAFDAALADRATLTPDNFTEVLADAVEWPYALDRLLADGATPNHPSSFGKTPLMVAAHLNRADAVEKLLAAGARVDAATVSVPSYLDGPERANRTALMYAAENAGPAVIQALFEAGTHESLRDSTGRDLAYYLSLNPRFTAEERALGVTGLAKETEQFAGPSFQCAAASTAVEQSICKSPTLRIFDAEMARAFTSLQKKVGPSLRIEQRRWLKVRDHSCHAGQDVDCLAELMRTHVRSLHTRLLE